MNEKLMVGNRKWTLLEGIYEETISSVVEKEEGCCFLYTGTLNARYGILDLIKAFSLIQGDQYQLWICGYGDSLEVKNKAIESDGRIKYLGIKNSDEVRLLQRKATILVNPRHSTEEYTKYSFPSKTMEYLASGTPVVMSHLASIPSEYDSHIFYFEDESIEGMRKTIIEICNKPSDELMAFGEKASEFINANKTPQPQIAKVLDFIKSI